MRKQIDIFPFPSCVNCEARSKIGKQKQWIESSSVDLYFTRNPLSLVAESIDKLVNKKFNLNSNERIIEKQHWLVLRHLIQIPRNKLKQMAVY